MGEHSRRSSVEELQHTAAPCQPAAAGALGTRRDNGDFQHIETDNFQESLYLLIMP